MNTHILLPASGGSPFLSAPFFKPQGVEDQQLVVSHLTARNLGQPQRLYKSHEHYQHPPRQLKNFLFTHNFAAGKFVGESAFPSHGWQQGVLIHDPVTRAKIYRYNYAYGGQGVGIS